MGLDFVLDICPESRVRPCYHGVSGSGAACDVLHTDCICVSWGSPNAISLFGDYVLDPDRRELSRGSEAIAIGPQVFDLLVYLVQNRDACVSKDDLFDAVWDGRIVSEFTLTSHINAVRKAIGDSGEEQRLIRTIARKGFRFVGEVKEADRRRRCCPEGRSADSRCCGKGLRTASGASQTGRPSPSCLS